MIMFFELQQIQKGISFNVNKKNQHSYLHLNNIYAFITVFLGFHRFLLSR